MKKLSITLFTLIWISLFGFSTASAGGIGFGITGSFIDVDASGTEEESTNTSDASTRTASVSNDAEIASYYIEMAADNGFALGFEMTPGAADVSDTVKTRTDTETSVTGTTTETSNSRKFTAQAEVEDLLVVYTEIPVWGSVYGRVGWAEVDVNTTEVKSGNGGNYGNTTVNGINLGIGVKGMLRDNITWKASYEQIDFSTLTIKSTGNSAGSGTNTITADVDTEALRVSIGYQF